MIGHAVGEKKSVKRKRTQQNAAVHFGDGEGVDEQSETPDMTANHATDDFESNFKPKVKTKMELESEPDLVLPSDVEQLGVVQERIKIPDVLVNHVVLPTTISTTGIDLMNNSSAGPPSPLLQDDDDDVEDQPKSSSVLPPSSVAGHQPRIHQPRDDISDTSSAIVNHVSDGSVMTDEMRTGGKVSIVSKVDIGESIPTIKSGQVVAVDPLPAAVKSSNEPIDPQVTRPSSSPQPSGGPPVPGVVTEEKVQSGDQAGPETPVKDLEPVVMTGVVVATDKSAVVSTDVESVSSNIIQPKCEVEDTLNDVKRDDFFAGKLHPLSHLKLMLMFCIFTCRTGRRRRIERASDQK